MIHNARVQHLPWSGSLWQVCLYAPVALTDGRRGALNDLHKELNIKILNSRKALVSEW